jgi:two-component system nitrogen regulation sensor histidine kinase NtrY
MVDEFSNFARMPEPVMESEDLNRLAEQAIFLQETANPDLAFVRELADQPASILCDRRQIDRALTNLLQNAIESVRARLEAPNLPQGEVRVRVEADEQAWAIVILDNGRGLPAEERHKLTEPYVTTRERGTGLGLAIVKKIMEDHGGEVALTNRPEGGACVRLIFPVGEEAGQGTEPEGQARAQA